MAPRLTSIMGKGISLKGAPKGTGLISGKAVSKGITSVPLPRPAAVRPGGLAQSVALKRKIDQVTGAVAHQQQATKPRFIMKPLAASPLANKLGKGLANTGGQGTGVSSLAGMASTMSRTTFVSPAAAPFRNRMLTAVQPGSAQVVSIGGLKGGKGGTDGAQVSGSKGQLVKGKFKNVGVANLETQLKKVEVMTKHLLDSVEAVPEREREQALTVVATIFAERLTLEQKSSLSDQVLSYTESPEAEEDPEGEPEKDEAAEWDESGDAAPLVDGARFKDSMDALLQEASEKEWDDWVSSWCGINIGPEEEHDAVLGLLEACVRDPGGRAELTATLIAELVRSDQLSVKSVEHAMTAFSGKLEAILATNEKGWHTSSNVIMFLFPKTLSSSWGLDQAGWNFDEWWAFTQRVLSTADHFRGFDIIVHVLQLMQERTGAVINQVPCWTYCDRIAQVRHVLGQWGEMDDASMVDTLMSYGVEI